MSNFAQWETYIDYREDRKEGLSGHDRRTIEIFGDSAAETIRLYYSLEGDSPDSYFKRNKWDYLDDFDPNNLHARNAVIEEYNALFSAVDAANAYHDKCELTKLTIGRLKEIAFSKVLDPEFGMTSNIPEDKRVAVTVYRRGDESHDTK